MPNKEGVLTDEDMVNLWAKHASPSPNPDDKTYTDADMTNMMKQRPQPAPVPSPDQATKEKWDATSRISPEDAAALHTTLGTVGQVGGGMLGEAVGGPPGAVVLAGGGAMAGHALADFMSGKKPEINETATQGLLGSAGEYGAQKIVQGVGALAETGPGKYLVDKANQYVIKPIASVAHKLTGTPNVATETLLKRAPEIAQQYKDAGSSTDEMAINVKNKLNTGLTNTIKDLNKQIEDIIISHGPEKTIDVTPIKKSLENHLNYIKTFDTGPINENAVSQIQDTVDKINKMAPDGKMNSVQLYDIKQQLGEAAKAAYKKAPDLFIKGADSVAKKTISASGEAASKARGIIQENVPELTGVDRQFQAIRRGQEKLTNRSILDPNKPAAGLIAAGANPNSMNAKTLAYLGKKSGTDITPDLENLVAAKYLQNPQFVPYDIASRPILRQLGMAGIGAAGGMEESDNPYLGALIGGGIGSLATSPQILKYGLLGLRGAARNIPRGLLGYGANKLTEKSK